MIYRLEGTLLIEADDDAEAASILAEINRTIESMDVCGDLNMTLVEASTFMWAPRWKTLDALP